MAEDLTPRIQEHEAYLAQLERLKSQVNGIEPTPFQRINPRAAQQFRDDRNKKLIEIEQAAKRSEMDLTHLRTQAQKTAGGGEKAVTPAQALAQKKDVRSQQEKVDTDETATKLAKNKLEQQKAADAASAVTLGAGGRTLPQLLANSTIKRDADGNYVFSQPNEGGKLTPEQTRAAKALAAGLKSSGISDDPSTLFTTDNVPKFDSKGQSVLVPGGNPYIGTQANYTALAKLYQASQPSASTDFPVPATSLNTAFAAAAPAYGDALPRNPVAIDAATPAANEFVEAGRDQTPALKSSIAQFGAPIDLASGLQMKRPVTIPSAPVFGPAEAPPAERAASKVAAISQSTGLPPEKVTSIFAASPDPEIQRRAIDQERSSRSAALLASQAGDVAGTAYRYLTVPGLTEKGIELTGELPGMIDRGVQGLSEKIQAERLLDAKARAARGLPPLDVENPPVDYQPGA